MLLLACSVLPTILRLPCKGRSEHLKHDPNGLGRLVSVSLPNARIIVCLALAQWIP